MVGANVLSCYLPVIFISHRSPPPVLLLYYWIFGFYYFIVLFHSNKICTSCQVLNGRLIPPPKVSVKNLETYLNFVMYQNEVKWRATSKTQVRINKVKSRYYGLKVEVNIWYFKKFFSFFKIRWLWPEGTN